MIDMYKHTELVIKYQQTVNKFILAYDLDCNHQINFLPFNMEPLVSYRSQITRNYEKN